MKLNLSEMVETLERRQRNYEKEAQVQPAEPTEGLFAWDALGRLYTHRGKTSFEEWLGPQYHDFYEVGEVAREYDPEDNINFYFIRTSMQNDNSVRRIPEYFGLQRAALQMTVLTRDVASSTFYKLRKSLADIRNPEQQVQALKDIFQQSGMEYLTNPHT